jgi:hypothetical protein
MISRYFIIISLTNVLTVTLLVNTFPYFHGKWRQTITPTTFYHWLLLSQMKAIRTCSPRPNTQHCKMHFYLHIIASTALRLPVNLMLKFPVKVFIPPTQVRRSQDSVVSILARLWAGWPRVRLLAWSRAVSPEHLDCLQRPNSKLTNGCFRVLRPGVKWMGHEGDCSRPSVDVKNEQSCISPPPMCLHGI